MTYTHFTGKMWMLRCLLLISVVVAWDPVRPGALVKQVGDMIIVNESVRVVLNFKNVTKVRGVLSDIEKGLTKIKDKLVNLETTPIYTRLVTKFAICEDRLKELQRHFLEEENRTKRAAPVIAAVGLGAMIGVTSIGFYTHLSGKVNTLMEEVPKIESLEESVKDIEETIGDITDNIEKLSVDHVNLEQSMDIYMMLDQVFLKLNEIQTGLATFIQDLVLANAGHVTSTLLSIPQLVKIVDNAHRDWNFQSFFTKDSLSMYYPLLTSYLNDSAVVIDIPFSSELHYRIYQIRPFPMYFNGSFYTLETPMVKPTNYVLSLDGRKESKILQDDLQECRKANINLYLCPAYMFTMQQALSSSCESSLVKNISVMRHCYFTQVKDMVPRHENLHDTHYLFFPNRTKVSIICPSLEPKVAAVYGLYRVPDQCELHAPYMSTIANRQNTFKMNQGDILLKINLELGNRTQVIKIRRLEKHIVTSHRGHTYSGLYYLYIIPVVALVILCVVGIYCCKKRLRKIVETQQEVKDLHHISATSSRLP